MIRVAIADDHELIRGGFAALIGNQADMSFVGAAETVAETYDLLKTRVCDVLVLDIGLPDSRGLEVLQSVRRQYPSVAVLVLSMHSEQKYGLPALENGAAGYLTKGMDSRVLLGAIRRVASGGRFVSADLAERLADAHTGRIGGKRHDTLSNRELQVLLEIAQGTSTGRIADRLALSTNTVQTYRRRILQKLGVQSNAELIRYVITHHLSDE